ncbi:hypothetical protein [Virgibacillus alimentarius]|uniref:hypothetical protein n=1 Tax=Virgibacillus alimentarius TaxID=698769 RepID=UPI0004931218|nr:hypothetical protein [Virgibacillus alimentarius]
MDENGRIYFDVDENPIRSIVSEDGNISNITNYYDAYIDVLESEAYELPEDKHKETAYNMFISHPPEELAGKDPSEYRSWEEATNLERGIIQITYFAAPPLNEIGYSIQEDNYTDGAFKDARKKLEDLGSPNVLIPAPQSVYDMQLYKNMQQVHSLWGQIGQFENPDENRKEFQQVYQQLRDEMNNIIVRVNFTLSEDPNGNDDPSKEK